VLFNDWHIYRVDTSNASCTGTSYVPGQQGLLAFGMGSVFNSTTGVDTLYIAGSASFPVSAANLGTLDLQTFQSKLIGPVSIQAPELAGTGDGQLWAFSPNLPNNPMPTLARLDPLTGITLETHDLSAINSTGGYAIKFWGGAFYIFVGADVWKVPRSTLVPTQSLPTSPPTLVYSNPGLDIVGAGVSTCAPVQ
jgi:hypothetical protein